MENIMFNSAQQISDVLDKADRREIFLPSWIAGRYNQAELYPISVPFPMTIAMLSHIRTVHGMAMHKL